MRLGIVSFCRLDVMRERKESSEVKASLLRGCVQILLDANTNMSQYEHRRSCPENLRAKNSFLNESQCAQEMMEEFFHVFVESRDLGDIFSNSTTRSNRRRASRSNRSPRFPHSLYHG